MKVRKVQVLRKNHPYKVKVDIDLYFRAEKEIMTYKRTGSKFRNCENLKRLRGRFDGQNEKKLEMIEKLQKIICVSEQLR